jgi:hypothetical protein
MLESMLLLLRGLPQSTLSTDTYLGLIGLIRSVYGDHAADTLNQFFELDDGMVVCTNEVEDALKICLEGR